MPTGLAGTPWQKPLFSAPLPEPKQQTMFTAAQARIEEIAGDLKDRRDVLGRADPGWQLHFRFGRLF